MDLKARIKKLPSSSGIYLFFNKKKEFIYVGKASNLQSRVRSYFSGKKTLRPIEQMIHEVTNIKVIETDSVLEAVILEGEYIKKYRPKYNIDWKDDKSWNYIIITHDKYPRVETLRQHEIKNFKSKISNFRLIFGPYPGVNTKNMMRLLQRLFYISTCSPEAKRPCLYYQMGQCLGVCAGEITVTNYKQKVIRPLTMFLRGQKKRLITNLEKRMKIEAKQENFEEAARLRNQVSALQRIQDVALLNKSFVTSPQTPSFKGEEVRIEGYDISNLGSSGMVGSMVVFDGNGPVKKEYRKFKIKNVKGQSDVGCLGEILERRLRHSGWKLPDVILVDGGVPQVRKACEVLRVQGIKRPVLGIAKGVKRKKNDFVLGDKNRRFIKWVSENKELLIQVRDEAHRFAITYQKKLRKIRK